MRNVILSLFSFLIFNTAEAADMAKLQVKTEGMGNAKGYYLCIPGMGCFNLQQGNLGKVFPITAGPVNNLILMNFKTRKMFVQPLPHTGGITLQNGQKLMIRATLQGNTLRNLQLSIKY